MASTRSSLAEYHPLALHGALEQLHRFYHHRHYVHPDPLEFVWRYDDPADREVVGLIAAALAYGRVAQILRNLESALGPLGPAPAAFVRASSARRLHGVCTGFRHRFTSGADLGNLLVAIRRALVAYGSLEGCFLRHHAGGAADTHDALNGFAKEVTSLGFPSSNYLIPIPERGSACKRLHLYLRWMVRCDAVDPGAWTGVSPAQLIAPLDTHMHKVALGLGLVTRKQPGLAAARELTAAFRQWCPDDPLRYDFVLTRLGIRSELDIHAWIRQQRLPAGTGRV
jgi:uncharacterized protein (TIGR02757 family)